MVGARLLAVLQAGAFAGDCVGDNVVVGRAEHPVCGDEVQLSLRVVDGCVQEAAWRAQGCPATLAVAALAAQVLRAVPVGAVQPTLTQALAAHGGLAVAERHAEAMVQRALAAALAEVP
jgi:NifU-like protein involved in Fe-S cluster formation